MPISFSPSRRRFARRLAGMGAAAYLGGLVRDAWAQPASSPLRLIVLQNQHGCAPALWRPRGPGGAAAGETGWTLDHDPDASLGPLERHKASLLLIEGLDLYCLYKPGASGLTGHAGGVIATLTGRDARTANDRRPTGPSLDVVLASQLKVKPFLYRQLGYAGANTGISYDSAGEGVPMHYDLRDLHRAWFPGPAMAGAGTGAPAVDAKAAARRAAESSLARYIRGEATALRARVGSVERQKLDAHLEWLSLTEQRLAAPQAAPAAGCSTPAAPGRGQDVTLELRTSMQILVQAMACNLTRVGTILMDASNYMPNLELGGAQRHVHNDVVHSYRPEDATSARYVSRVQRYYAEQVAYLCDLLKSTAAEGGKTLHDRTIVLWVNELGDPARHSCSDLPFVVAGGGGTFRRGRYVAAGTGSNNAHNRLLTSIANQFGAGVGHFGDPELPGELPGLV
jgi:hypothetical protein